MSINIKSEEAHRLATELASLMNTSLTQAVTDALRSMLQHIKGKKAPSLSDELLAMGRESAAHMQEPWKSGDINELLYDEHGFPK